MMSQTQTSGQQRDTQAISQNKDYASIQAELEDWFIISFAQGSSKNIRLLTVWHIFTAGLNYCKDSGSPGGNSSFSVLLVVLYVHVFWQYTSTRSIGFHVWQSGW